jgi:hypothetical protein
MNITDGEAARVSNSSQEVNKTEYSKTARRLNARGHLVQPPFDGKGGGRVLMDTQGKEFPGTPLDRKAAVRRYACTSNNDGHYYFCTLFSRPFSCQRLRRIRRPRRSVILSRERRFFNTTVPLVMELMGEGMDRRQFP